MCVTQVIDELYVQVKTTGPEQLPTCEGQGGKVCSKALDSYFVFFNICFCFLRPCVGAIAKLGPSPNSRVALFSEQREPPTRNSSFQPKLSK